MENDRVLFTKEMKHTHTILIPDMLPIHFGILCNVFREYGYKVEHIRTRESTRETQVIQTGLKYVHNDTCYPALLVIGQLIDALQSGKYDINKVALMITQTGGGCRASNYVCLLRKALKRAGLEHIPVISLSVGNMESNPGLKVTLPIVRKASAAVIYGDELMLLSNQVRPYEIEKGRTDKLLSEWIVKISDAFKNGTAYQFTRMKKTMKEIAEDFSNIPVNKEKKIKVGIVGEIYIKYSDLGNNGLEEFLLEQECEYMLPGLLGFVMYCIDSRLTNYKLYGGKYFGYLAVKILMKYITSMEKMLHKVVSATNFNRAELFSHTKTLVKGIVGHGSVMGEGWLLTAEMVELSKQGYSNIICAQPFGCLPNHVNGRGMLNRIKELYSQANIVAIDYDPGASRVNQENRIKLMLASAKESMPDL